MGDWGLSKHLLHHSKSVEGYSPEYAAAEQFDDEYGAPDHQTDVYQLCAILYELYTSEPPFTGWTIEVMRKIADESIMSPLAVDSSLPDDLDEIPIRALPKEKRNRYKDVLYLRDDLQSLFERS